MNSGILDMEEGAIYDRKKDETRFGVFSEHAEKVELCLFNEHGREKRVSMKKNKDTNVWKVNLKGVKPGQKYGYRAYGEYDPDNGMYFNPRKLLVDPYAYEIERSFEWDESLRCGNDADSAPHVPKCVVADIERLLKLPKVPPPDIPGRELFIYEAHVRGMTMRNPNVPLDDRGTFKGMAHPSVIGHLKNLGVNAVEIMPTQSVSVPPHLGTQKIKKIDYWGYNTITYNATDPKFGDLKDLKDMINVYHAAGIKVIMDVVYNHTGEGGEKDISRSVCLSMRGLDHQAYYRTYRGEKTDNSGNIVRDAAGNAVMQEKPDDASGCGNALDLNKPNGFLITERSLELLAEIGVDGFRFDLASANARDETGNFNEKTAFMRLPIDNDRLKGALFIAEPWACGGGHIKADLYQPKGFAKAEKWLYWSGEARDDIRKFVCGKGNDNGVTGRISYNQAHRCSENTCVVFPSCHDGFTLHDFFQYKEKNNWANGEDNRDGDNSPGAGYGENPKHIARCMANAFAVTILSGGIPMLSMGDEFARTQNGNNNAYCQDNDISYLKWKPLSDEYRDLPKLIGTLAKLRKEHPSLDERSYNEKTVLWLDPYGFVMKGDEAWRSPSFSFYLSGKNNDDLMVIMNMGENPTDWHLPEAADGMPWLVVCSTRDIGMEAYKYDVKGNSYRVDGCETVILRSRTGAELSSAKNRAKAFPGMYFAGW